MAGWSDVLPLAGRNLRTWWVRYAILGGLAGLGLATFVVASGSWRVVACAAALAVEPLDLPAAVVLRTSAAVPPPLLEEVLAGPGVAAVDFARVERGLTVAGDVDVWAFPPDAAVLARGLELVAGRGARGPDEVMVPLTLSRLAGLEPGGRLPVRFMLPGERPGPVRELRVVGVFRPVSRLLDVPLISMAGVSVAGQTAAFIHVRPGEDPDEIAGRLRARLQASGMQGTVMTAATPIREATLRSADVFGPTRRALALALGFVGLGSFTVLLAGFLDRKRELAILKTVGADQRVIGALFLAEVGLAAGLGVLAGVAGGLWAAGWVRAALARPVEPGAASVAWGVVVTLAVVGLSVLLPLALARAATVNQLLTDARVHLVTQRVRIGRGA